MREAIQKITILVSEMQNFHDGVKAKEEDLKDFLPYDVSHFCYTLEHVIREFKESALKKIADRFIRESLPNTGLTSEGIYKELEREDQDSFNVSALLEKLKEYEANARELSLENIRNLAKRLLPHPSFWDEQKQPNIRKGKVLTLRAYTWDNQFNNLSYHASTAFEEIAALDKLCRIVLGKADPISVESQAFWRLENIRRLSTNGEKFYGVKHQIGFFEIQFYKNGNARVMFSSEWAAKKVANELLGKNGNIAEPELEVFSK